MGYHMILHRKEGMEKSTNKCGGSVVDGVRHALNLIAKAALLVLNRSGGKRAYITF